MEINLFLRGWTDKKMNDLCSISVEEYQEYVSGDKVLIIYISSIRLDRASEF